MAVVPYRVAAEMDRQLETRTFQLGGQTLIIRQDPAGSGSLAASRAERSADEEGCVAGRPGRGPPGEDEEGLGNVGLVVWQSAFVLAEYLLRNPPFGQWADVTAVDLGSGTGVVGIALAGAGAEVVLTDLPHILHLTQQNLDANLKAYHKARAAVLRWGDGAAPAAVGGRPSLITCSDCVYQPQYYPVLADTIVSLSAPHTLTYVAYKPPRVATTTDDLGRKEAAFERMLEERKLVVAVVPAKHLHEEYRDGQYRVLRICRIDPDADETSASP